MADISRYFPSFMGEIREFKALNKAENPEIGAVEAAIEFSLENQFVKTAGEYGIERLEKILEIYPKADDTLKERKFRVLVKLNEYIPYTWEALRDMLDGLLGEDGHESERILGEFLVVVRISIANKKMLNVIGALLERIVPVNMGISLSVLYERHYEAGRYRNGFLKSHLNGYTHKQIRHRELPVFTQHELAFEERNLDLSKFRHWYIRTGAIDYGFLTFTDHEYVSVNLEEELKCFKHEHIREEMFEE